MNFKKYLVFFIKRYKIMMNVIYDFYFDIDSNNCFFDIFNINKLFE